MSSARFVYAIVVGKGKSIFDGGRGLLTMYVYVSIRAIIWAGK